MYFSHKESATEKECLRQSTKFEDDNKVIDGEFIKEFLRDVDTDSDLKWMYSYYKDIVFRTDHGYGSGDKMKKITEKQKSILDAIGKDHEKNPYMSLSEEVLTVYIHHILVKKFGYDMVQVFKTNDFDDTFRKTDYIVSIDGEYVAIDLYMGDDDVAIRNKESAATVVNNLDFQTTKDGLWAPKKMPRTALHIPTYKKDFIFEMINSYYSVLSWFDTKEDLQNAFIENEFLSSSFMEELISDTQEQYNKKELKYQDFVHNGEIIPASKKDRVQQSIEAAIMQSIAPVSHKLAQKSIKEKEQNNADVIDNILNEDAA